MHKNNRLFFFADSTGRIYQTGPIEQWKANFHISGLAKSALPGYEESTNAGRIIGIFSQSPINAYITTKGLGFFAPFSMNKTTECDQVSFFWSVKKFRITMERLLVGEFQAKV